LHARATSILPRPLLADFAHTPPRPPTRPYTQQAGARTVGSDECIGCNVSRFCQIETRLRV
ncbi:hypothetical protein RTBOTA2_005094, partial [Rhodotorula toruloides]